MHSPEVSSFEVIARNYCDEELFEKPQKRGLCPGHGTGQALRGSSNFFPSALFGRK